MRQILRRFGEYLKTKDGQDQITGWAIKIVFGFVLAIASTAVVTLQQTIFAPPSTKLHRSLVTEVSDLLPRDRHSITYWLGVYQYQQNKSMRCRAYVAYPIGVSPKIARCSSTGESVRRELMLLHQRDKCQMLWRSQVPKESSMMATWTAFNLIGVASCPIIVQGDLWGYFALSLPLFEDGEPNEIILRSGAVDVATGAKAIAVAKMGADKIERYFSAHPDQLAIEVTED